MSQADIDAFVADQPPASATLPSLAEAGDLQTIKLFSLNDYLGLSTHPAVRQAAADAALQCGNGEAACCGELRGEAATVCQSACGQICFALLMLYPRSKPLPNQVRPCLVRPAPPRPAGPRSSALVGGYTSWHRDLEAALAQLKGTEDCLLFPTGFAANLAVASALCRDGNVVVLSDELNHASIVDGARLGRRDGAKLLVYRHNDLAHLEQLLRSECPPGGACQMGVWGVLWGPVGRGRLEGCAAYSATGPFAVTTQPRPCPCVVTTQPLAVTTPLQAGGQWCSPTACSAWTAILPTCAAWRSCGGDTASCWCAALRCAVPCRAVPCCAMCRLSFTGRGCHAESGPDTAHLAVHPLCRLSTMLTPPWCAASAAAAQPRCWGCLTRWTCMWARSGGCWRSIYLCVESRGWDAPLLLCFSLHETPQAACNRLSKLHSQTDPRVPCSAPSVLQQGVWLPGRVCGLQPAVEGLPGQRWTHPSLLHSSTGTGRRRCAGGAARCGR